MNPASRPIASPPRRRGAERANTIFVGIVCGLALLLVILIVTHTFGRAAL